jgi:hypothetical protein
MRSRNIKQNDLISSRFAVRRSQFRRIARIPQLLELNALHDASGSNVETSDDSFCQHRFAIVPRANTLQSTEVLQQL